MSASLIFKLPYEPALDGLRALAVLSVMLFHAYPAVWPGGFLGVDVFFVLSGYLITSLLLKEFEFTGRLNIPAFYLRRWWRLGPALIVMLFVYGCIVFSEGGTLVQQGLDIALALGYLTNWSRAFEWRSPVDLGHTWSLAVEEQYYLLWPLILWSILRFLKRGRPWLVALVGLVVLSWAWRQGLQWQGATVNRLYNGLDTRAEALLVGSLLAVSLHLRGNQSWTDSWQKFSAFGMGLAFITLTGLMLVTQWTDAWLYTAGMSGVALMTGVMVWALHHMDSGVWGRILRGRVCVYLGRISYGLYLWHFPIDRALMAQGLQGWVLVAISTSLSVMVASISYRWIEQPALRWRDR